MNNHIKRTTIAVLMACSSCLCAEDTDEVKKAKQAAYEYNESQKSIGNFEDNLSWRYKWRARFLDPSLRIYFDVGTDDVGEIDLFEDGTLTATINLAELYKPLFISSTMLKGGNEISFGPSFGIGITNAQNSDSTKSSDAPVLMLTAGVLLEIQKSDTVSFGIEYGIAKGYSTDESLMDTDDTATYVGLRATIDF